MARGNENHENGLFCNTIRDSDHHRYSTCTPKNPESVDDFLYYYTPEQHHIWKFIECQDCDSNHRFEDINQGYLQNPLNQEPEIWKFICDPYKNEGKDNQIQGNKDRDRSIARGSALQKISFKSTNPKKRTEKLLLQSKEEKRRQQNREAQRRLREKRMLQSHFLVAPSFLQLKRI